MPDLSITDATAPDRTVDLRDQVCPMTFVRTRLALESLLPGQTMLVLLAGAEPLARVPLTVLQQGHRIVSAVTDEDGHMRLLIRKRGPEA